MGIARRACVRDANTLAAADNIRIVAFTSTMLREKIRVSH
jgi:hypothetical protein